MMKLEQEKYIYFDYSRSPDKQYLICIRQICFILNLNYFMLHTVQVSFFKNKNQIEELFIVFKEISHHLYLENLKVYIKQEEKAESGVPWLEYSMITKLCIYKLVKKYD